MLHSSYRNYLKEVLSERVKKNPAYSMRSFAKQVGLASSTLCEIMKGKGNLSPDSARRVAARMGLNEIEAEYFCLLVEFESAKSVEAKEAVLNQLKRLRPNHKIHDLSIDQFHTIADWYYSAILEMTYLEALQFNAAEISKRLGISRLQAEVAIERLERLELIEKDASGRIRKTSDYLQVASAIPNEAIRKFYKQMLEKATEAVDVQTPAEKLSGGETLPFNPESLPQAKAIIERCFSEMIQLSKSSPKKTKVYHLGIHFFNLTQSKN